MSKAKHMNTGDQIAVIPQRWPMQMVQAISNQHVSLLERVLETCALPKDAINSPVQAFSRGAPFEYWDYVCNFMHEGFYDAITVPPGKSMVLFDRVIAGDTLLHLALRSYAFDCAKVLLQHGASLHWANSQQQKPLHVLFELQSLLLERQKLGEAASQAIADDRKPTQAQVLGISEFVLEKRIWPDNHVQCDHLVQLVAKELQEYHRQVRDQAQVDLRALYRQHAPERICKIESQMEEYQRRELLLVDMVKRKYENSIKA